MVRTKDTGIYKTTVELCKVRYDQMAKNISVRLLSLNDLVHAEARYHTKCRSSFENPVPQNATPGRPVSSEKLRCFEKACAKLEEDTELYTITEFHELMREFGKEEVYTVRMTVEKLKSRYGSSVEFILAKISISTKSFSLHVQNVIRMILNSFKPGSKHVTPLSVVQNSWCWTQV